MHRIGGVNGHSMKYDTNVQVCVQVLLSNRRGDVIGSQRVSPVERQRLQQTYAAVVGVATIGDRQS